MWCTHCRGTGRVPKLSYDVETGYQPDGDEPCVCMQEEPDLEV